MERLNTLKFQLTFSDNCRLLNDQIQLVNEACHFLYQSLHIQKLLEVSSCLCFFFINIKFEFRSYFLYLII
jgi:hypothetical protein